MGRCTGHRDITEILLKTALKTYNGILSILIKSKILSFAREVRRRKKKNTHTHTECQAKNLLVNLNYKFYMFLNFNTQTCL